MRSAGVRIGSEGTGVWYGWGTLHLKPSFSSSTEFILLPTARPAGWRLYGRPLEIPLLVISFTDRGIGEGERVFKAPLPPILWVLMPVAIPFDVFFLWRWDLELLSQIPRSIEAALCLIPASRAVHAAMSRSQMACIFFSAAQLRTLIPTRSDISRRLSIVNLSGFLTTICDVLNSWHLSAKRSRSVLSDLKKRL